LNTEAPIVLDGLTVKELPDGSISILINQDRLLAALKNTTKAANGCTHATARKRISPHKLNGLTHLAPVVTQVRG
jgi:hypothetical protein